jgi:hypothetical protein
MAETMRNRQQLEDAALEVHELAKLEDLKL